MAEHFRGSGILGVEVMTKLCNKMLDGEGSPEDWKSTVLVPLYKGKGDTRECGSYSWIRLLEHRFKIMERVVER